MSEIDIYSGSTNIDDPIITQFRKATLVNKKFLSMIYQEWYERLENISIKSGRSLEIGSGPGFLKKYIQNTITSEVFFVPGIDIVADAMMLPFSSESLSNIFMTDVLHHIPDVSKFFEESERCLINKGRIIMVEPWNNSWAKLIYTKLHHEPFNIYSDWKINSTGPLTGANGALPWIVFVRDKVLFEKKYPNLKIIIIEPLMPISYILSGGLKYKFGLPKFFYRLIRIIENKFLSEDLFGMFAIITIEKNTNS
jgi:SAM-dependent methyltransferase